MLASGAVLSESEWPGSDDNNNNNVCPGMHSPPRPSHWSAGENGEFSLVKRDKMVTIVSCAVQPHYWFYFYVSSRKSATNMEQILQNKKKQKSHAQLH